MKTIILISLFSLSFASLLVAEKTKAVQKQEKQIHTLIDQYSQARETKDGELLKKILVEDIDQLVSSGTWRRGLDAALAGMMRSSTSRPGSRTLTIEHIRFLDKNNAIADARYEVKNEDGSMRKMWSTFIVKQEGKHWKIAAIRNMLPAQ